MGTILKQQPEEDIYYDFEDQVCLEYYGNNLIICGNRDFQSFGDETLIKVIKGDYYDDDLGPDGEEIGYDYDTLEELKKLTGKTYKQTCIRGYCQSDWQYVYYTEDITDAQLKEIEDFFMGKVQEFVDEDCCGYLVPDDIVWDGREAICNYLGLDPATTIINKISGSHKVYDYEVI